MNKKAGLVSLFYIVLGMVFFGCSEKTQQLTELEKSAAHMLEKMGNSAIELDQMLAKVADIRMVNTADRMRQGVRIITDAEKTLVKANQDVEEYLSFIHVKSRVLKFEKLDHYIAVANVLNGYLVKKRGALEHYLVSMKRWLTYGADHFEAIQSGESSYRQGYDVYYTEVKRSKKSYELNSHRYHQFAKSYLKKHPAFSKYFKKEIKTLKENLTWM